MHAMTKVLVGLLCVAAGAQASAQILFFPADLTVGELQVTLPDGVAQRPGAPLRAEVRLRIQRAGVIPVATAPVRVYINRPDAFGFPQSLEVYRDPAWPVDALTLRVVDLDTPAVRAFAAGSAVGSPWWFSVWIDPLENGDTAGQVFEGGTPDVEFANNLGETPHSPLYHLYPLTGTITMATGAPANLMTGTLSATGCAAGQLALGPATLTWLPSDNGLWEPSSVIVDAAGVCVVPVAAAGGFDLVWAQGLSRAVVSEGQINGLSATAVLALTPDGPFVPFLRLALPDEHTAHPIRRERGLEGWAPRGQPYVDYYTQIGTLGAPVDGDLGTLTGTLGPFFLHVRDLPFLLRVERLSFGDDRVHGVFGGGAHRWVHDLAWHPRDDRHAARLGPISNDARFAKPLSGIETFDLDPAGLDTSLVFAGGNHRAHFPRITSAEVGFSTTLTDGRLPAATVGADGATYAFSQRSRCPGTCADYGRVRHFAPLARGPEVFDADGAMAVKVSRVSERDLNGQVHPEGAHWGPSVQLPGLGQRATFERTQDADRTGVLVVPGFTFHDIQGRVVAPIDGLLGSWLVSPAGVGGLGPDQLAPRGAFLSKLGNGFFAGVTLGPETLRSLLGQVVVGDGESLGGANPGRTRVAFGGPVVPDSVVEVDDNPGTKFVFRSGGVTGTFTASQAPALISVYGHELRLRRFAFRLVANRMDEVSWLDGELTVGGNADFRVPFVSLTVECSGHLGGGVVDAQALAAIGRQRLKAWRAPFALRRMGFVAPDGDLCVDADRPLRAGGALTLAALSEPLDLDTDWTPAGVPLNARANPGSVVELDKRGAKRGFDLMLSGPAALSGPTGEGRGWFSLESKVLVPFWMAMPATVRVQNGDLTPTGDATPQRSLVMKAGTEQAAWQVLDNEAVAPLLKADAAANLPARYEWGSSSVAIDFETKWLPDGREAQAAFEGVPKDSDLWVVTVRGNTDYINPDRTRVSFGASADLAKLGEGIDLTVDLTDPASVARVDGFLGTLGVPGTPVKSFVGALEAPARFLTDNLGSAFDDFLAQGVDLALVALEQETGVFSTLAGALSTVQRLPSEATKAIFDPIQAELGKALSGVFGGLNAAIDEVEQALYAAASDVAWAAYSGAQVPGQALEGLASARAGLKVVDGALQSAVGGLGQIGTLLDQADSALMTLDTQVGDRVAQASGAVCTLRRALGATAPPGGWSCSAPSGALALLQCEGNPLLERVREVNRQITALADALGNTTLTSLVQSVGSFAGVDTTSVTVAQREIAKVGKDIATRLTSLTASLEASFCGPAIRDLLVKLDQKLLAKIDTTMAQAAALLSGPAGAFKLLRSKIADAKKLLSPNEPGSLVQRLGQARLVLARLDGLLGELAGSSLGGELLMDAAGLPIAPCVNPANPCATEAQVRAAVEFRLRAILTEAVQAIDPSFTGLRSLTAQLEAQLRKPIDDLLTAVQTQIGAQLATLTALVPFPTAEELRTHVRTLIMSAPFIAELDKLVHENLALVAKEANQLTHQLLDHLSRLLKSLTEKVSAAINSALQAATSSIKEAIGVEAAKIDGYAVMQGSELERLHIGAEFKLSGEGDDDDTSFGAALDIESWASNGKGKACLPAPDPNGPPAGSGYFDASITARGLPIVIGPGDMTIRLLTLGFTLNQIVPQGFFGAIETAGTMDFQTFKLRDVAFFLGVGALENYLGAKAAAWFQGISVQAAFLIGRTCNDKVLVQLDPEVASFIGPLPEGFSGAYVRGAASVPIYNIGCLFTIGAGVDVGFWMLVRAAGILVGGLVGGSAYGKLVCLVGLRGGIRLLGQYYAGDFTFEGTGWGAGGIGFSCDPEDWVTREASREDGGCGTFDAGFTARYRGGFEMDAPSIDGMF